MLAHINETIVLDEFLQDENVFDAMKSLIVSSFTSSSNCTCEDCYDEQQEDKASLLAAKTEIVAEIDTYKDNIMYVKENYPHIYEKEEAFLNEVLNPAKIRILENKLNSESMRFFRKHPRLMKRIVKGEEDDLDFASEVEYNPGTTYVRQEPKTGRNDPCPCGSGKKYKRCCG